jgi:DNA repair protein RadC
MESSRASAGGSVRAGTLGAEGPRERLLRLGPAALTEPDLLAALLGTGMRGCTVENLSRALLEAAGGLKALRQLDPHELCQMRGLGPARGVRILAALELGRRATLASETRPRLSSPREIHAYLAPTLAGLRREVFHVLSFNSRNVLLCDVRVAEGTMSACPVDPKEVFAAALARRATAIVLAHNHPSGDVEPSEQDLQLTRQLCQGGRLLGIRVLDHLVVGDASYCSLLERGWMPAKAEVAAWSAHGAG